MLFRSEELDHRSCKTVPNGWCRLDRRNKRLSRFRLLYLQRTLSEKGTMLCDILPRVHLEFNSDIKEPLHRFILCKTWVLLHKSMTEKLQHPWYSCVKGLVNICT